MNLTKDQAIALWKEKVWDKEQEIDPNQEEDWGSMAVGFALALGFTPEESYKFMFKLSEKGIL